MLPKSAELPQHRTIEEVRAIIDRKGLTEAETEGLWDAIYLTTAEVAELLALVRDRARYPWIFPMFCLVAYTGMRRSSMLLSRVDEVDLRRNLVFVRSRKFERGLTESRLEVPMHPNLKAVMAGLAGPSPRRPVHDHPGRPGPADQGRGPPPFQARAGGDEVRGGPGLPRLPPQHVLEPGQQGRLAGDHRQRRGPPDRRDEAAGTGTCSPKTASPGSRSSTSEIARIKV